MATAIRGEFTFEAATHEESYSLWLRSIDGISLGANTYHGQGGR